MSIKRPTLLSLGLILFLCASAMLTIGDYEVRLANSSLDDNPVAFTDLAQHPSHYQNDLIRTYGPQFSVLSAQNWGTILLAKWVHVPAEFTTWILTLLQNLLLGIALFRLIKVSTSREDLAWLGFALAWAIQPWSWNLANYATCLYIAYPGQFALPFLIFSATAAIEHKTLTATFLMALAGLIHPALALFLVAITALFWLMDVKKVPTTTNLLRMGALILVMLICIGPALFLRAGGAPLDPSLIMRGLTKNAHANPFCHPAFWKITLPSFTIFLLLALLACRERKGLSTEAWKFWQASLASSMLLTAAHGAGLQLGLSQIVQLIPSRATTLFLIFSVPLLALWLSKLIHSGTAMTRWLALLTACSLALAGPTHIYLTVPTFIAALVAATLLTWATKRPVAAIGDRRLDCVGVSEVRDHRSRLQVDVPVGWNDLRTSLPVVFLLGCSLWWASVTGASSEGDLQVANCDAQLWARAHTPTDSLFITFMPWRTISQRPALLPMTDPYVSFSHSAEARAYNESITSFFTSRALSPEEIRGIREELKCDSYLALDTAGVRDLGKMFGARYAVRPVLCPLALPEVHRNRNLIIYALP